MSTAKERVFDKDEVKTKIVHLLGIYPIISPTMLQSGLGPYIKPAVWRPALTELITEGRVLESQESLQTPAERYNTYTKLRLNDTPDFMGDHISG